jgi:hypothetical protein
MTSAAINIKRALRNRGAQWPQNERKGKMLARFTFICSPHSEQNFTARID